ncbi:MAG: hypothetical protein APR53_01880 [Methanoculleus sp. SDB]|nr:MAG: hypothetical protein APR53_01880 [Methanoculleus sp. SDB]
MKHVGLTLILLLCCCAGIASAQESAAQVSVTSVTIDPAVLMRGDTATITVVITNSGTTAVAISRATLLDTGITLLNDQSYASVGDIGAANSMTFTFSVRADVPDGIYYPKFYLDYRNAGALRYRIPVKVDDTELEVSVLSQPDSFVKDKKETIVLKIGNPRENELNGITIVPEGEGVAAVQTGFFVGSLLPDQSETVSFDVTPTQSTDLVFHISYRNGLNRHMSDLVVPVVLTTGKRQADPILNNIAVTSESGYYRVSGDVTNAGLDTAYSVIITAGTPAEPVDPFRVYVVGALDADDFSSFEVTFRASDAASAPLIVQYKDVDGNTFTRSVPVELGSGAAEPDQGGEIPVMLIAFLVVLVVAIGGIILYTWKKK